MDAFLDFFIRTGVAALLAGIGVNWNLARQRKDAARKYSRERIEAQIRDYYGPLHALNAAGEEAFLSFKNRFLFDDRESDRKVIAQADFFADASKLPDQAQLKAWMLWTQEIFLPLNERRQDIILRLHHLSVQSEIPPSFAAFLAHAQAFRATVANWKAGGIDERTGRSRSDFCPALPFPAAFDREVAATLKALEAERVKLLQQEARWWALFRP
ncbi:hypothetical protein HB662_06420 [Roseomonas frigidaquae]|uniref:DUF4760 domain-containing protein n=1 Tax=Falsiroseomonas frigidaquae TaxID=487318 RepID=A0ABX1EWH4_9PROT|nr:hypothetical protein [Falsiroseomonas frigidaquae]NKE44405.1 hypothetical protein [Falsiroseomonas frigidaquae]